METGAHLEERSHPAPHGHLAFSGFSDAGEYLEEGGLAGAVSADDPQNLPLGDFQRHPPQGPDGVGSGGGVRRRPGFPEPKKGLPPKPGEAFPQGAVGAAAVPQAVLLPQVVNGNSHGRGGGHKRAL